jgi:hypothetical protein
MLSVVQPETIMLRLLLPAFIITIARLVEPLLVFRIPIFALGMNAFVLNWRKLQGDRTCQPFYGGALG